MLPSSENSKYTIDVHAQGSRALRFLVFSLYCWRQCHEEADLKNYAEVQHYAAPKLTRRHIIKEAEYSTASCDESIRSSSRLLRCATARLLLIGTVATVTCTFAVALRRMLLVDTVVAVAIILGASTAGTRGATCTAVTDASTVFSHVNAERVGQRCAIWFCWWLE